jgi:F-type H+-transporting ATPase subunit delta
MEALIAQKYAKAIFETKNSALISEFAEVLNNLSSAFEKSKSICSTLSSPLLSDDNKTKSILDAIGDKVDAKVINFIKLLGENKRLSLIPSISKIINAKLQKETNSYQGVICSNKQLEKSEISQLESTLSRHTGSAISLKEIKSDIEGIKVSVDDLGIEVNFSKQRVKDQLIDFINRAF